MLTGPIDDAVRATPASGLGMVGMYDWLAADPQRALLGGGLDAIAGFNHPGREPGRFGSFAYDQRMRDRMVSMEIFNRGEDYLFEGTDVGIISPLTDCLDKGWRVGLLGVTDEHGTNWGYPDGKGRTGLYVKELTRAGVREAMTARRFFSTRLRGLRVGATAQGIAMGSTVRHRKGPVRFAIDVDRGPGSVGRPLVRAGPHDRHPAAQGGARADLHHPAGRTAAAVRGAHRRRGWPLDRPPPHRSDGDR